MKKILYPFLILSLLIGFVACSDDLETAPTDSVTGPVLFETTDGAQVAMNGVYRMLFVSGWTTGNTHQNFGIMSTKLYTSLMGEDFLQDAQGSGWFYFDYRFDVRSRYTATTWRPYATWNFYYTLISNVNYILAEEENLPGDPAVVDNIMAQAYAMRAYAYFQLIQGFQQTYVGNQSKPGIPLYTEATTAASEGKSRGTVEEVYTQINSDLDAAILKFSGNKDSQAHKSNMDYYVTNAIKANVALVQNKWSDAATFSKEALSKKSLSLTKGNDLYSGFNNRNLSSVLWGSEIIADQATIYASFFSHMDPRATGKYGQTSRKCIYNWLYDQVSPQDVRKKWWNGATWTGDPKQKDEPWAKPYTQQKFYYSEASTDLGDYIYMRAEEMQLVLAEALCHDKKFAEAEAELMKLLVVRYPTGYDFSTIKNAEKSSELKMGSIGSPVTLMDHIILQRRIELWGESERIYDLQRLKMGFDRNAPGSNHSQKITSSCTFRFYCM